MESESSNNISSDNNAGHEPGPNPLTRDFHTTSRSSSSSPSTEVESRSPSRALSAILWPTLDQVKLNHARMKLALVLPHDHEFQSRICRRTGKLLPIQPNGRPRVLFTNPAEGRKKSSKNISDPGYALRRSQLIKMWDYEPNAPRDIEDYDNSRPKMARLKRRYRVREVEADRKVKRQIADPKKRKHFTDKPTPTRSLEDNIWDSVTRPRISQKDKENLTVESVLTGLVPLRTDSSICSNSTDPTTGIDNSGSKPKPYAANAHAHATRRQKMPKNRQRMIELLHARASRAKDFQALERTRYPSFNNSSFDVSCPTDGGYEHVTFNAMPLKDDTKTPATTPRSADKVEEWDDFLFDQDDGTEGLFPRHGWPQPRTMAAHSTGSSSKDSVGCGGEDALEMLNTDIALPTDVEMEKKKPEKETDYDNQFENVGFDDPLFDPDMLKMFQAEKRAS